MDTPLQISFHNMVGSQPLEGWIRHKVRKLEDLYPRLVGCRVAVEEPNHHHRRGKGRHFRVRVELAVPGELLVADRDGPEMTAHEDAYLAVTKTFEPALAGIVIRTPSEDGRAEAGFPRGERVNRFVRDSTRMPYLG